MDSSTDDAKAFPEWNVEKIAAKIEVNKRHISAGYETSADMTFHAAEKLFAENRIDRITIDFLLLCTQSPDCLHCPLCPEDKKLPLKWTGSIAEWV
jgi:3-oxoacyl-[acyl-carrier-protein] synthase-3